MSGTKLRGVNLGGWLILEPWITPSLFVTSTSKDEYTLMQEPGAAEIIERHRQTFIQEGDFRWLQEHGVNALRIPVGYWLLDGDGPYTAGVDYLDWAMAMAEKYQLQMLIDLHGAPGSQNGNDHSGRIGKPLWFDSQENQAQTLEVLCRLAERYRDSPSLWGIELLNEPSFGPFKYRKLKRFYGQAYQALTEILQPGTKVVFSDAFWPQVFSGLLTATSDHPLVMDVHWYQTDYAKIDRYFARLAGRPREIESLQRRQPIIVGEWSGMLSHKTLAGKSAQEQTRLETEHIDRQLAAYETAAGWFYWTYKTEGHGIWNFRLQVESGALLLV